MVDPRYVVVDLNALDEGLHNFINDDDHVVLPHMMVSDIAGNDRRRKHANCFPRWLKGRGEQVWLAKDPVTLEMLEKTPYDRIGPLDWRDDEESNRLRIGKNNTPEEWLEMLASFETSDQRQAIVEGKEAFFGLCQQIGEDMKRYGPDLKHEFNNSSNWYETAKNLIREPFLGYVLPRVTAKRFRSEQWRDAFSRFPDELARGRMSRMICWYAMLDVGGVRPVEGNDVEDLSYAHAASYTGYLATQDGGLQKMVQAVFPSVVILGKQ